MPKREIQSFNEANTKQVHGYGGSTGGKIETERVHNTYGSCAGAGSGEFDVYRQAKRREQMRLEHLEREDEEKRKKEEFEQKVAGNKREAEERMAKNAEKRKKKKLKQMQNKAKYRRGETGKSGSEEAGSVDGDSGDGADVGNSKALDGADACIKSSYEETSVIQANPVPSASSAL